jgi:uncharacterized membrane protein YkvA (DUF1232 family)
MKPNIAQEQSGPIPDTQTDLAAWIFSGDRAHIDEFILAGSSGIQAEHLRAITNESELVYAKIYAARQAGLNELKDHSRLMIRALELAARSHAMDPLPAYLAEGTFAVQYLLKGDDLIPDQIPGVGLIDDAMLIKRVFLRNKRQFMEVETLPAIAPSL